MIRPGFYKSPIGLIFGLEVKHVKTYYINGLDHETGLRWFTFCITWRTTWETITWEDLDSYLYSPKIYKIGSSPLSIVVTKVPLLNPTYIFHIVLFSFCKTFWMNNINPSGTGGWDEMRLCETVQTHVLFFVSLIELLKCITCRYFSFFSPLSFWQMLFFFFFFLFSFFVLALDLLCQEIFSHWILCVCVLFFFFKARDPTAGKPLSTHRGFPAQRIWIPFCFMTYFVVKRNEPLSSEALHFLLSLFFFLRG